MWNKIRKISTKFLYKSHTSALNTQLLRKFAKKLHQNDTLLHTRAWGLGKISYLVVKGRKKFDLIST